MKRSKDDPANGETHDREADGILNKPGIKRPRVDQSQSVGDNVVRDTNMDLNVVDHDKAIDDTAKKPAPKYGSKEYWEARYKSHSSGIENAGEDEACVVDGVELTKDATKPGHEWYFTYDELRPLILPLILGTSDEDSEDEHDEDGESWEEEEGGEEEQEEEEECNEEDEGDHSKNDMDGSEVIALGDSRHQIEQEHETADEDEDDMNHQADPVKATNASNQKPKRVLEVGCGDVPLGTSLVSEFSSQQSDADHGTQHVIEEVTCIDYSETVVQSLIEKYITKHKAEQDQSGSTKDAMHQLTKDQNRLQPTFRALDARSLPFPSNTYDLILEKGTIDAMLSDEEEGLSNCIQIVKEMARVTSDGGAVLIVSHMNANEPKGMRWLEDVVFRGLKDEFEERHQTNKNSTETNAGKNPGAIGDGKEYVWSVEVHGGDGKLVDANGDQVEGDASDDAILVYGPAVYVVKKRGVTASVAKEFFGKSKDDGLKTAKDSSTDGNEILEADPEDDDAVMEMPPVRLQFLTYD
ncbi:hypothetical protein ACHAWF_004607 [Thalassiosira exigua]